MAPLRNWRIWARVLLVAVLAPLLGISARDHSVTRELSRARVAAMEGRMEAAAFSAARAAQQAPGEAGLWEQAAGYALEAGLPEQAVSYFAEIPPERLSPESRLVYGDALLQNGETEAAIARWQEAASQGADPEAAASRLLDAHLALQDVEGAISALETLVALHPENPELSLQLGMALAAVRPEEAIPHLERAAEGGERLARQAGGLRRRLVAGRLDGDPAVLFMEAGRGLAGLQAWALARESFQRAATIRPDFADAWAYLGEALQQTATDSPLDEEAGLAELEQALALNPQSVAAHTFMALYWQRHGEASRAVESLEQAVSLDAENPALHAELGSALARAGDLTAAAGAYRQAVALSPNENTYLILLADFSIRYDYQVEALGVQAARQAVIRDPDDPDALDAMAQVLVKLNDLTNAERFLLRALEADPEHPLVLAHLGLVHFFQGRHEQAAGELERARALDEAGPAGVLAERYLKRYFSNQ